MSVLEVVRSCDTKVLNIALIFILAGCGVSNKEEALASSNVLVIQPAAETVVCDKGLLDKESSADSFIINGQPAYHIANLLNELMNPSKDIDIAMLQSLRDRGSEADVLPGLYTSVTYRPLKRPAIVRGVRSLVWKKYFGSCRPYRAYIVYGSPVTKDARKIYSSIEEDKLILQSIIDLRKSLKGMGYSLGALESTVIGHIPNPYITYTAHKDNVLITWRATNRELYLREDMTIYIFDLENNGE